MKLRRVGTIEASEIGMGCMGFSHGYGQIPSIKYSIEAIQQAVQIGCSFFDTAERYGRDLYYFGHNEEILGEALKGTRKNVVIATKFHLTKNEVEEKGSVYIVIKDHLLASLRCLQTDYIDLYYYHRINKDISLEDVALAMKRLIQEGYIKGWGLSQVSVETLKRAHKITRVSAVQNIYSMVERDAEVEVIPYCLENNIAFVAFSPIASGLLSGRITTKTKFEEKDDVRRYVPQLSLENREKTQPFVTYLIEFAKKKHVTPAQISLAWMLYKYPNVIPIPGSKNQERIIENLNASMVSLTQKEFLDLEEAMKQYKIYGHRGQEEYAGSSIKDWGKSK